MRKRDLPVAHIREQAELFGVSPELYWLMKTKTAWDQLVNAARESNRGVVVGKPAYPIEELRAALATLEAILGD